MIYFIALIPATALTIAGYFVLYLSNRSEGTFQRFGRYLGFWAFTLGGLVVLGAIFAAAHGGHHGRMHGFCPPGPRVPVPGEETPRPGEQNPAAPPSPASPSPH